MLEKAFQSNKAGFDCFLVIGSFSVESESQRIVYISLKYW